MTTTTTFGDLAVGARFRFVKDGASFVKVSAGWYQDPNWIVATVHADSTRRRAPKTAVVISA